MNGLLVLLVLLAPISRARADEVPPSDGPPSTGAEANERTEYVTQTDLQGVRAELETLREQWTRTLDKNTAQTSRPLTVGGIAQVRYTASENKKVNNSFDIAALILNFRGNLRKDYEEGRNVDYLFSFVSPSGANANGSADFTVRPLDAYISYFLLPSLDFEKPLLSITLGQQKKPFGLEALATEEKKPTIKSAQSATTLGLDPRDIGLVVKGDLFPYYDAGFRYRVPLVEYSVGLLNGSGPNATDDNGHKDVSGRVVLNAPVDYNSIFRGLSLGGSAYLGRQNVGVGTAVAQQGAKNRYGVDLAYVNTPVGFTAEYVRGEDGKLLSGTSVDNAVFGKIQSEGFTFTVFYNFGEQFLRGFKAQDRYDDWYPLTFQPFVRFDRWDPNLKAGGDRIDITTLGFNWFFAETTKLQLNYNNKKQQGVNVANNEFLAQFQFGF
jgi:hypothetical protein